MDGIKYQDQNCLAAAAYKWNEMYILYNESYLTDGNSRQFSQGDYAHCRPS